MSKTQAREKHWLWDPSAAVRWSLLFTPLFGSLILAADWSELGEIERMKGNFLWAALSGICLALIILFRRNVNPAAALAALLIVFVAWYFISGAPQAAHMQKMTGGEYNKKRWLVPVLAAAVCAAVYIPSFTGLPAQRPAGTTNETPYTGGEYFEKNGGFSYTPPEGWEILSVKKLKFKIARGPVNDNFAPNMVFIEQPNGETLDRFVEQNLAYMKRFIKGFRLIDASGFKTRDGLAGKVIRAADNLENRQLYQVFYIFENNRKKYLVTCTALEKDSKIFGPLFEKSVKTFKFSTPQNQPAQGTAAKKATAPLKPSR
jgi:hypothetical protein